MGAVTYPTSQTRKNQDQSEEWAMELDMPSLDPFHQAGAFLLGAVQPITSTVLNPTLFHEGIRISQLSSLCLHLLPDAPLLRQTKPSGVLHFQQQKFHLDLLPLQLEKFLHSL